VVPVEKLTKGCSYRVKPLRANGCRRQGASSLPLWTGARCDDCGTEGGDRKDDGSSQECTSQGKAEWAEKNPTEKIIQEEWIGEE